MKKLLTLAAAVALVAAACGGDSDATATTSSPTTTDAPVTTAAPTTAAPATTPPTGPAEVVFADQTSDGASITVASVTLPAPGFIAVHANADGAPGPIVGHSALLPEGTSSDVAVTLDEPLAATDLLFPMVHIDMDGDGEYAFFPPDNVVDVPATTADGSIAVVGATVTVEAMTDAVGSLTIAASSLGDIVVDGEGTSLYLFDPDQQGESVCYDQCATTWPPLTVTVMAGTGIDAALLGTTDRTDGTTQVTYNGWPLYYFAGDSTPGDTNGQGVNDVWYVVDAAGDPIQ